jgi:ribonuclease PH
LRITPGVAKFAAGSARIELGDTHVLCTASVSEGVPAWLRGSGRGWLTAEYSMLPGATPTRTPREAVRGRQSGRTMEIQRLIGRSLRSVVDMGVLGERTVAVDCDVLQADGGTRTASVSGAYVAVHQALRGVQQLHGLAQLPLFDSIAAVSVGLADGRLLLDLDYEEDAAADVDMNVVVTGDGRLVEVQATAEGEPFARATLDDMLGLAAAGATTIAAAQAAAVAEPA